MSPPTESIKMERKFFEMEMANLSLNYRQKMDMKTVDWYWKHLQRYPKENLARAIKFLIEKEEYFPTIATFKKYLDPELEFSTPAPFPTFKEIKGETPIGRLTLDLIFKRLNKEITVDEYCVELEKLEEKFPSVKPISFGRAGEVLRKNKKRSDELPVLNWKSKEWPFSKTKKEISPVLEGQEAAAFEEKREIAKIRYPYKDE